MGDEVTRVSRLVSQSGPASYSSAASQSFGRASSSTRASLFRSLDAPSHSSTLEKHNPQAMMSPAWITLALVALAAGMPTDNNQTISTDDEFTPYKGERFDEFDWSLLQNLGSGGKGNILISPFSLKLGLVLLYEGAQEETARELAKALRLPAKIEAIRTQYSTILRSMQVKNAEYTLNYGNRIYLDSSIVPRQTYTSTVKLWYHTDVIHDKSFAEPHPVAEAINDFAKNATNGHVDKLIDDEAKLKDSLMVLVSAMYFQGNWHKQPFEEKDTKADKFYLTDKSTIDVPFMRSNKNFYMAYIEEINSKILRLPYAGKKFAMYIVLPQSPGQLDFVLQKITPKLLADKLSLMQDLPVDVMLPKFKFEFTSHLESNLRELGIRDIFEPTATLTGIPKSKTTSKQLVVSDVIQKTGIDINEKGSTAYVATAVELGNKMGDETFHATHPFLFYIEDETSGTIAYMGIVNDPLEKSRVSQPLPELNLPSRFGVLEGAASSQTTDDYLSTQNFFNIELLNELCATKAGNVVVGSSSVKAALMVLTEAAAGRTRQQIIASLRLPTDLAAIRKFAARTINPFKDDKSGTELQSAIKLWTQKELLPAKEFSDALRQYYKSELEAVEFKDVAKTVKAVNDWVKKYTNGLIDSIVDSGSLPAETKMLLTTAVYFKGTWLNSFDKSATATRCFNVPRVGCKDVPLMESVNTYKYAYVGNLRSQVVQIPYKGGRVSMLVVLPTSEDEDAIENLSRDLAFTPIPQILSQLVDTELLLQLPKFSISNKIDLRVNLETLKINDLFNKNSNLTVAFPDHTVQVGAVLHNARIEVNEEGTVAAAITGVSVIPLMGTTMTTFRADRPFAFFLLDLQTNNILFAGRYVQPEP